ncbi:Keratin, type I cytoskeletal 18 [Myotis davidii]|uniref:Keratin, type I cytoskeletal 18 n=1 Tax=Myotis davidii TaxID=225400 RepID=L5LHX9_MYODS|nr:Keratin, type I cytoskeletal 18 [Myotis davidii]
MAESAVAVAGASPASPAALRSSEPSGKEQGGLDYERDVDIPQGLLDWERVQAGLWDPPFPPNITQAQLETEIEALKEQLLFMKKNQEEEVNGLQSQIANSGLTTELDASNLSTSGYPGPYDELAQRN